MEQNPQNTSNIVIPFGAIVCRERNEARKTVVCEIPEAVLRAHNEPRNIDELLAEASLEHALGNTKTFDTVDDLIADLRS